MANSNERFIFRIWSKNSSSYFPLDDLYMKLTDGSIHDEEWSYSMRVGRLYEQDWPMVIEQCTGLKDKNGVLIFEGDIVVFNDGYGDSKPRLVEWNNGFCNCSKYDTGGATTAYPYVIGNIHENPELLEQ